MRMLGGEVQLSPISPVTITMFGTAFGGVGLIASHALALPVLFSLPMALLSGLIIAGVAFYAFSKLFQATESSSEAHVTELVGLEAEVITPIPPHGLGEIAYVARGTRFTAPARSEDGKPHLAPSTVLIARITDNIFCVREPAEPNRMLATVLFTDIVGSTEQAAALGDRRWRDLLETHHSAVRRELTRFQGREIDTAGDGFLAIFDQPVQAIHCACAISDAVRRLGIEIRAGLHMGECEVVGDKMRGIAVHIGARVAALAASGGDPALQYGEGPGGRRRHSIRGSGQACAEGHSGGMAVVRRHSWRRSRAPSLALTARARDGLSRLVARLRAPG